MPGSPRSESPIVDGLHSLQRYPSSLRDLWERLDLRSILFPKLLGVGGGAGLDPTVCFEIFVVPLEHLLVAGLDLPQGLKSPEVLEGCIDFALGFPQLPNLLGDFGV